MEMKEIMEILKAINKAEIMSTLSAIEEKIRGRNSLHEETAKR
jgi:hypothetical protein